VAATGKQEDKIATLIHNKETEDGKK